MALLTAMAAVPSTAQAQVYEVSPEGELLVRDGGGAAVWQPQNAALNSQPEEISLEAPAASATIIDRANVPVQFARALEYAAASADVSPTLLAALVWQESRWNPQAVSPKGAVGLTQLMPGTARELGVDSRDPLQNLLGGARYLRMLLNSFDGNVEKALAAYNAGPGRVRRAGGIPAIRETRDYVRAIVNRVSLTSSGANL